MLPENPQISDFPDHLYPALAHYPLRDRIEPFLCCRHPYTSRHLHTKPLCELTADELSLYAIRAEPEAALDVKPDPETKCTGFWEDAEPQWRQVLARRNQ